MTPEEFAQRVVDVSPGDDLRFITPPAGIGGESATTAKLQPEDADAVLMQDARLTQRTPPPERPAASQEANRPTSIRVRKQVPPGQAAFDDLMSFLDNLPATIPPKTGTFRVLGHRVATTHRRHIARLAGLALLEHMSSWEFARVVQTGGFGLESYMRTLQGIRDDAEAEPRDRMTAADKLIQLYSVFMPGTIQESLPKPGSESPGNLMQILVDIRGEGEANAETRLPEEAGIRTLGDSHASD